jgi:hypothetical protein
MMNNNKILTVSYGTFSCTLEGFDDSFGTMKAIAEYFRDLAADDRYFGAEPPQPDAEMLARIAQKEISRRVEARQHEGRIVLSAQQEDAQVQPAPAAAVAPAAIAPIAAEQMTRAAHLEADDAETEQAQTTEDLIAGTVDADQATPVAENTAPEPIAEEPAELEVAEVEEQKAPAPKTASAQADVAIEDVAAEVTIQVQPEDEKPAHTDVVQETHVAVEETVAEAETASAESFVEEDVAMEAPVDADAEDTAEAEQHKTLSDADADVAGHVIADEDVEETAEEFFANSVSAIEADDEAEGALHSELTLPQDDAIVAEDVPAPAAALPESIADKLQRIRAVVSQSQSAPVQEAEYDVEDGTPATANDAFLTDFMAGADDAVAAEDFPETDAVAEAAADIEDAFDADDALEQAAIEAGDDTEDDDLAAALDRFDAVANDRADIAEDEGTREVISLAGYEVFEVYVEDAAEIEDLTASAADDLDEEDDVEDMLDNLFHNETAADLDDDAETDAMVSSLVADEAETTTAPDARLMKVKQSDIEAALDAEEVAADALAPTQDDAAVDVVEDAAEDEVAARHMPKLQDNKDADVSRLMAEADSQMAEPESAGRRKAFAHLRAAVAAKKADWLMGKKDAAEDSDQAYRSDLADAVKPRRPVVNDVPRTERPNLDAQNGPLKLVAEQRVDAPRPDGPVTPRRISATPEERIADAASESFSAFADEMGATKLPDLLEAAAAYLSFVEGHDQFSRPQLMTKVRQVENEGFNREDSLRSFGQLLRSGKIQKIKGGRFTVSEDIGFKPDERAAG